MIGLPLPSLAPMDAGSTLRVWLATAPADMRCGFDRLALLAQQVTGQDPLCGPSAPPARRPAWTAQQVTGQDPLCGHLFLFRSRGGDRLKVLYWDRDGSVLWYKRLEAGTFRFPRTAEGQAGVEMRPSELAMLLEGIDLSSVKRRPRFALLRKNALFAGKERGGRTAAVLSSLTSTCRRHGADPRRYLTQLLTNLPSTPLSQLDSWLPDRWAAARVSATSTTCRC